MGGAWEWAARGNGRRGAALLCEAAILRAARSERDRTHRLGPSKFGLSAFVLAFTLSCSPPVNASIKSETTIRKRPYGLSFLPTFFLPPPKLKMQTPSVIAATCAYSNAEYRLPPRTMPPAITGTILHDLPRTWVGYETKRRASLEAAIASICETPDWKMSLCGMFRPDLPSAVMPANAVSALTPRSINSARNVAAKNSPP